MAKLQTLLIFRRVNSDKNFVTFSYSNRFLKFNEFRIQGIKFGRVGFSVFY